MFLFLKIMLTVFIAEMGDKTQMMLIALTSKYKLRDIILGTAFAILVLNGIAVLAGGLFSEIIPTWLIRFAAAAAFLFFALSSLSKEEEETEDTVEKRRISFAPLSVFCTFFVAELGDKTQLTAITFGANEGLSAAITVWLACSLGLFAADIIGMLAGYLLQKSIKEDLLHLIAYFIFAIFGNITMHQALELFLGTGHALIFPLTIGIAVLFVAISAVLFFRQNFQKK